MDPERIAEAGRLTKLIYSAFRDCQPTEQSAFFKAVAERDYTEFYPRKENRAKLREDIAVEDLTTYPDLLFYFDENTFYYYLPRYVEVILKDESLLRHQVTEDVIFALAEAGKENLNESQIESVRALLCFFRDKIHPIYELDENILAAAIAHYRS